MKAALATIQTVALRRDLPEICPPVQTLCRRERPKLALQAIVALGPNRPPAWIECLLRPSDNRSLLTTIRERYAAQGDAFDLEVLEAALDQLAMLQADTRIGINIHPESLHADRFAERVLERTRRRHVAPSRLVLELVEYEGAVDLDRARPALERLRGAGVAIALDDFGPGAPNFDVVAAGLVDWIKLDASLCRRVDRDDGARRVVAGLAALVHHAGPRLIAEGIERPGQMRALRTLGIHHQQGFLFHRPVAAPPVPTLRQRH